MDPIWTPQVFLNNILQALKTDTEFDLCAVKLFTNDIAVSPATLLADLVEADYSGYVMQSSAPLGSTYDDTAKNATLAMSSVLFQPTGTAITNVIYGWWLTALGGAFNGQLLAIGKLPFPISLESPADALVVNPRISINQPVPVVGP